MDGETLAIWPRDEVRGALLRRTVELSDSPSLTFDAGVDAGRTWHLVVFVNNDKVHDHLVEGNPPIPGNAPARRWEHIRLDLAAYSQRSVTIRLYDLVLVPNHYAGNSYWRNLQLQ